MMARRPLRLQLTLLLPPPVKVVGPWKLVRAYLGSGKFVDFLEVSELLWESDEG